MSFGLIRVITKSGIITSNPIFYSGSWFLGFLRKILFLRCSPLVLKKVNSPRAFTNMVATLSVGPTHKTTDFGRHDNVDNIMFEFIDKLKKVFFADIGVSDGVSSLKLYSRIKHKSKLKRFYLLDKYNSFGYKRKWYGYKFYNTDKDLVYIQLFNLFLLHMYPLLRHKSGSAVYDGIVTFENPLLKERKLEIKEFDVFKSDLEHKVNVVKCANLLNSPYFSQKSVLRALKNINRNMIDNGFLFIIQNNRKYNGNIAMIVLQKKGKGFELVLDYHDHELSDMMAKFFGARK